MTRPVFPPRVRDLILIRDRYCCVLCGSKRNVTIYDRRDKPVTVGNPAAGITVCKGLSTQNCFDWLKSNKGLAIADGYLVEHGVNPADVGFQHAAHGFVYLSSRGTPMKYPERLK